MRTFERLRSRMLEAILEPFSHGSQPLANTLDHVGDPGLFGPDSVTWPVMGDVAALFGGVRALLIQFAHPEVAAGMQDHSGYEADPLGRISRTTDYVAATSFGAMPEVEKAVAAVRRAHRVVQGASHRGRDYHADDADLTAWVHNALADSFLVAYQTFGPDRLSEEDADRYAVEQGRLGRLMGADTTPETAAELSGWLARHPSIGPSPGAAGAVPFIASPPAGPLMRSGYKLLYWASCATLPSRLREALGVPKIPGAIAMGRFLARILRWAMGSSPAWLAAIVRSEAAPPPDVVFRQPLPGGARP